ncbi:hypothetical protein ACH5RR_036691 [Cinchona calisaya]|uniref:Uncharacterized protein n=1 Tax=Cinchona calisaya TaxID=153742 RepID=A0ABD2Y3Y0_9GENT
MIQHHHLDAISVVQTIGFEILGPLYYVAGLNLVHPHGQDIHLLVYDIKGWVVIRENGPDFCPSLKGAERIVHPDVLRWPLKFFLINLSTTRCIPCHSSSNRPSMSLNGEF